MSLEVVDWRRIVEKAVRVFWGCSTPEEYALVAHASEKKERVFKGSTIKGYEVKPKPLEIRQ